MEPIVDHIEITVKDMEVAVPFYDKLMPPCDLTLRVRIVLSWKTRSFRL
jgi:hypothetical protein